MKNIYIDSTQIHSNTDNTLGFFVSPDIQGLEAPEIRLPTFNRPNIDGAVVPSQLYGGRLITIVGRVVGDGVSQYRTRRRQIEQAFSISRDGEGNAVPLVFKFQTMDDLLLQAEVYTRKFSLPDKHLTHGMFKADLFSPTLYLLGQVEKNTIIYPFDAGGMAIPFAVPLDISANASTSTPLNNAGNVDAYPTITINGPIEDPTIVNETQGQTMNLVHTLTSGQYIVIDTVNRTVLYYSSLGATPVNVREEVTGDFITLAPGDNIVKLTLGSFSTTGNIQFSWRDSYSGI